MEQRKRVGNLEAHGTEQGTGAEHPVLQGIIESIASPIFSVDTEYRYTSFNRAHQLTMKAIYGVDIEIGKNILDCHTVFEDRLIAKGNLDKALGGEHILEEGYAGAEDLTRKYFEVSHSPIVDIAQKIIGVAVCAFDITERKQSEVRLDANRELLEQARRESEERYQDLFEKSPSAILLHDQDVILAVNPALLSIGGYSESELIGSRVADLVHPEDRQLLAERILMIQEREIQTPPMEMRFVRKDGSFIYAEVTGGDCHYQGRKVVQSICHDFTARKQAETQIRLQNAVLEGINRIFRQAIHCETEEELRIVSLETARELTGSAIGFIGMFNAEGSLEFIALNGADSINALPDHGIITCRSKSDDFCGRVLQGGKAFFTNELAAQPDSILIPEKHPPLTSLLGAPLRDNGNIAGVIGLAHCNGSFRQEDLRTVEALSPVIVEALKRKKLERALQESEDQYRAIVDLSSDMIIVHQEFRIVYINQAGVGLLGATSPEQIIGRNILDLIHPDYREEVKARLPRIYENGITVYRAEQQYIRMDGSPVDVEAMASRILYRGKPAGEAVIRDISERKKAERLLRESEDRYRAFFENSIDAILLTSPEGKIYSANPEACRIFGMTEEELRIAGRNGVVDESDPRLLAALEERAATGRFKGELNCRRRGGSVFPAEVSTACFTDRNGMVKTAMIVRDITRRKQAEEALRQSEAQFRILAESLPQLVWTTDNEGRDGYINKRLQRFSGLDPQELKGCGWLKMIHPNDIGRVKACWQTAVQDGDLFENECRMRRHDGEYCWFLARGLPLRADSGHIIGWFGTCTDIHYQKRLEQELQESNERLHQLNQQVITKLEEERGAVARELHDEAGQALVALKIFLELIRDGPPLVAETLQQQMDEAVSLTTATLERIRGLAQDLRPPALDTLGLSPTLEDFCRGFGRRVGMAIDYSGCELPEFSGAVRICLYRFLQEALTNVIKHAGANRIRVVLAFHHQDIILKVQDNGIGFQFAKGAGTPIKGMGLLGMQERLEMLGGKLEIDSKPGQGAIIIATIPWVATKSGTQIELCNNRLIF